MYERHSIEYVSNIYRTGCDLLHFQLDIYHLLKFSHENALVGFPQMTICMGQGEGDCWHLLAKDIFRFMTRDLAAITSRQNSSRSALLTRTFS